jgi:hypothetical protein
VIRRPVVESARDLEQVVECVVERPLVEARAIVARGVQPAEEELSREVTHECRRRHSMGEERAGVRGVRASGRPRNRAWTASRVATRRRSGG